MLCPFCHSQTKIYNSRATHQQTQTWRRHRCITCYKTFTTREKIDLDGVVNVQDGPEIHPYSRERLLLSLVRASNKIPLPAGMMTELADAIEAHLRAEQFFTLTQQHKTRIADAALIILTRYDKNIALQYLNQMYDNQPPIEQINHIMQS